MIIKKNQTDFPVYSTDIWDYLDDMPNMPSRKDRDSLLLLAQENSTYKKHVEIWDYFFQIDPNDVGIEQKKEKQLLEQKLIENNQKLSHYVERNQSEIGKLKEALSDLQQNYENKMNITAQLVRNEFSSKKKSKMIWGFLSALIGLPIIIIAVGFLLEEHPIFSVSCWFLSFPFIGFSIWMFISRVINYTETKVSEEITRRLYQSRNDLEVRKKEMYQRLEYLESELINTQQSLENEINIFRKRIEDLETQIKNLLVQIPPVPSDEQIELWLQENIRGLTELAIVQTGLEDRLIKIAKADNPFCLRGPAELQLNDLIPPPYLKKGTDRAKHLNARKFVTMSDGLFVDFYGVYNIGFILLAEDVLATYSTFYDFITGRQSGENSRVQHYADVVGVETSKGYREIEMNNEVVAMENVPSLQISLTSSETIAITFPDEDYFRQTEAKGYLSGRWKYDPHVSADNAIRATREKVNEAKRKRERRNER